MALLSKTKEALTRQAHTESASDLPDGWVGVVVFLMRIGLAIVAFTARWAWWLRSELSPLVIALGTFYAISALLGRVSFLPAPSGASLAASLGAAFYLGRRALRRRHASRQRRDAARFIFGIKRQWPVVMRSSGLAVVGRLTRKEQLPTLDNIRLIPGGLSVSVKLPSTIAPSHFESELPRVVSDLECIAVQVLPGKNLKYVRLDLYWHDALAIPLGAPNLSELTTGDIQTPAPVGVFADGSLANLAIYERHMLVGGASGSGKSVFVQLLLSWVALADNTRLYLLDAKGGVELGYWEQVALASGGAFATDQKDGIEVLDQLLDVMRARLAAMREAGIRKHVPTSDNPQIVLFIDEMAAFTQGLDKNAAKEFNARLYTLTAQGRAAAISIIAATQKPTIETVGAARDLFHYRVAFACSTPSMSDVILGEGQAQSGADACTIPAGMEGVGFILAEGDKVAKKFRAYYLADDELEALASYTATRRLDHQFQQPPQFPPSSPGGVLP